MAFSSCTPEEELLAECCKQRPVEICFRRQGSLVTSWVRLPSRKAHPVPNTVVLPPFATRWQYSSSQEISPFGEVKFNSVQCNSMPFTQDFQPSLVPRLLLGAEVPERGHHTLCPRPLRVWWEV